MGHGCVPPLTGFFIFAICSTVWGQKKQTRERVDFYPICFHSHAFIYIHIEITGLLYPVGHLHLLFISSYSGFSFRTLLDFSFPLRTESSVAGMATDSFDLASFFSDCGVPPAASASIVCSGWDVEKFALGFKSETEFDDTEVGVEEDLSRLHRAALKQAWNRCIQYCKTEIIADATEPSPRTSTAAPSGMTMDASEGVLE